MENSSIKHSIRDYFLVFFFNQLGIFAIFGWSNTTVSIYSTSDIFICIHCIDRSDTANSSKYKSGMQWQTIDFYGFFSPSTHWLPAMFKRWLKECQCWSVDRSNTVVQTDISHIGLTFCADIHGPLRMNPTGFSGPLTFP